jgi:hypothetical protein
MGTKLRFEVFKRDSFTCQYCGRKAPDVVLEMDHINPIRNGGETILLNLITSCFDCNRGKRGNLLTDKSVLEKKHNELSLMQERKSQIEMMCQWELDLQDTSSIQVKTLCKIWSNLTSSTINDLGKKRLLNLINKYPFPEICESMKASIATYINEPKDEPQAYFAIENIIKNTRLMKTNPELKELYYINGILNNRMENYDKQSGIILLKKLYKQGISTDELKELSLNIKNIYELKSLIKENYCG